jgi:hypothetical protein
MQMYSKHQSFTSLLNKLPTSSALPAAALPFVPSFTSQYAPFSTSDDKYITEVTKLNNLGWKYHNGIGVEQSYDKAKEYYARAIKISFFLNGSYKTTLDTKQNLTFLEDQVTHIKNHFFVGDLVDDLVKARLLFANATTEDDAESQYLMGEAYRRGEGVIQSHEKAQEWYAKATPERKLNRMARNTYICIFCVPNWVSATAEMITTLGAYFMFIHTLQTYFGYDVTSAYGWSVTWPQYAMFGSFWYPLKEVSVYCGKELWKKQIVGIRHSYLTKTFW